MEGPSPPREEADQSFPKPAWLQGLGSWPLSCAASKMRSENLHASHIFI